MRKSGFSFGNLDWILIGIYLLLVLFGWINIYAAVYNQDHSSIIDMSQRYGKQLLWIAASFILILLIFIIDPKFFNQFSYLIYGFHILTLIAVLLFGKEVAGSKSWFQFGSIAIQPAEFVKYSTALALAHFLSGIKELKLKQIVISGVIMFLPAALIVLQNDTGSALVYVSFILVLYRMGLPGGVFGVGFVMVILAILALVFNTLQEQIILTGVIFSLLAGLYYFMRKGFSAIMRLLAVFIISSGFIFSVGAGFNKLQPHQQDRIEVLLGLKDDPYGAGYNVHQSKIAIGSGEFTGKGFLKGTQTKFDFVPEQSTDFIFCTVGEEWGFIGAAGVVLLFVALLSRLIFVAERQRSSFAKYYGYGVASVLFFHFTINVGMVLGLLPTIGIPLPFFSYGGSSLWAFTILLFIFIRQDAERMNLL
ncbi:MAG: rod shape-determining protein RodA [Bacteroidetes bacterium]|nr:MAG: rod shape-determining protein RodA [Bacteroidota bacterium]